MAPHETLNKRYHGAFQRQPMDALQQDNVVCIVSDAGKDEKLHWRHKCCKMGAVSKRYFMYTPAWIMLAAWLLQSCAAIEFLYTPTPSPTHSPPPTPTASRTPTSTITLTPSKTPTPPNTFTPIPGFEAPTPVILPRADEATGLPVFQATADVPGEGFISVELTRHNLFWGTCKKNYTKITVIVEHPLDVHRVYLFARLESFKKPGETTPWFGTVMDNDGGGIFLYTLRANNIPERQNFLKAWVHYQFVAEDENKNIIGRTHVYTNDLTLEPCP